MAKVIAKPVLQRLEERVMCEMKIGERVLYKFAVDQLYLHQNLSGYDQQHTDEDSQFREESAVEDETENCTTPLTVCAI
jgi:hypothetical protein